MHLFWTYGGTKSRYEVIKNFSFTVVQCSTPGEERIQAYNIFWVSKIETLKVVYIWLTLSILQPHLMKTNEYIYYTDGLHIWKQLFLGEKFGKYRLVSSSLFVNICVLCFLETKALQEMWNMRVIFWIYFRWHRIMY